MGGDESEIYAADMIVSPSHVSVKVKGWFKKSLLCIADLTWDYMFITNGIDNVRMETVFSLEYVQ